MTFRRVRRPPRRIGGTILVAVAVVLLALVGSAGPAAAVTPRPTDYRSTVESIEPDAPVTVEVVGADTLLDLAAEPGHEVVVAGYGGEPYLRVQRDGTTEVNERSPAVSLNRTRDADIGGTDTGSVAADPEWRTIGHNGRLLWHDHRIHAQDTAEFGGAITWTVPITVDGTAVAVNGRLERVDPPSPLPYALLALAVAAGTWFVGRRRARLVAGTALVTGSLLAATTGFVEWHSLPAAVARNAGVFLLPVAAAGAAAAGLAIRHRTASLVALLASVSLLAGWLAFRWSILTRSVLISDLAPLADRTALAVVLGLAVAAAGLTVQWAGSPDAGEGVSRGRDRRRAPARPGTSPRAAG